MAISFENSSTKINLIKAFAGESQARNRYTFAASQAKKEGLQFLEKVFLFTADQEKEHAKLFYNNLKPVAGELLTLTADFPVDIYESTLDVLKAAQNNEYEEYNHAYQMFGDEAKSEGFEKIANLFYDIAKIEKVHGDRFGKFIEYIETNRLFESDKEETWICLNCGNIYTGKKAPEICPVCDHPQGYNIRHNWILI